MTVPPGRPEPDVLVSGDDRPSRRLGVRHRRAAAVLVVAAVVTGVGLQVHDHRADRERQQQADADAEVLRLALLSPGQDNAVRYGPSRSGLEVVVGNSGPATVRLLSATLVPGEWQVQVPPDPDVPPGDSAVLDLTPPAACGTPAARLLQVEVLLASGRRATAEFPLAGAQLADGGRLDDAVAAASLGCDPTAAPQSDRRTSPHSSEVVRPSR